MAPPGGTHRHGAEPVLRRTLIDFFDDLAQADGEFLTYDDGYRTWSYTYAAVAEAARGVAARLRREGIGKGDHVAIWSENRPEWIWTLWGCLLEGVVLVPIDYRASPDFLIRVAAIVNARAIVVGETVGDVAASVPVWAIQHVARPGEPENPRTREPVNPVLTSDDVAEVIFTSGATSEPKGVVLTHRNILANIVPIEREVAKYRKYTRLVRPIRFLNLLPLSHMFGQAMATFVPPMLPGTVVFTRSFAPQDIVTQIRTRRVSVLVCVPKILEVLREYIERTVPESLDPPPPGHWSKRWWRYRRAHRLFGYKFWAIVVGAAPLDPDLEAFFGRLGFLVVQGYGLTETAPIVTLNHPLRAARGAVGKPIPGVEVRIAEDGEILVRGENVTRGYFNAPEETKAAFRDGWFHTGDVGGFDEAGRLFIRGRKKEMIVTPEGLNVFPEDVERVLNDVPGVRESAVVGAPMPGSTAERVQAVLVTDAHGNVDDIVRAANARLQDHQKIRAAAVWPGTELPRTEGTRKLKRRELRDWLTGTRTNPDRARAGAGAAKRDAAEVLRRFAPGRTIVPSTTIDELGLSSLERVELMMALEEAFQVTVDESQFAAAKTVSDLDALASEMGTLNFSDPSRAETSSVPSSEPSDAEKLSVPISAEPIVFPAWNRSWPARALRRISLPTWILPLGRLFMRLKVEGLENLENIQGPVIFAANHQSHLDTPAILQALPARWRYRVAPAMAKEFFKVHFNPGQFGWRARLPNSANYYLASLFFNAFPLPQREAGTRQTLRYIGTLLSEGNSLLIFPEGKRTDAGEINPFRAGVGMIASKLGVPVVPVRLDGLDRILHQTWKAPQRGPGRVAFGPPISLTGSDYAALARQVEEAVRRL
jgi:long-chain acyl-CoA synthetase